MGYALLLWLLAVSTVAAQPPPGNSVPQDGPGGDRPREPQQNGTDGEGAWEPRGEPQNGTVGDRPWEPRNGTEGDRPWEPQNGTAGDRPSWRPSGTMGDFPMGEEKHSGPPGPCGAAGSESATFLGLSQADCLTAGSELQRRSGSCPYLAYRAGSANGQQRSTCLCYLSCTGAPQRAGDAEWQLVQVRRSDGGEHGKMRAAVIGGVCGGGGLLLICIGTALWWLRRRGRLPCWPAKLPTAGSATIPSPSIGWPALQVEDFEKPPNAFQDVVLGEPVAEAPTGHQPVFGKPVPVATVPHTGAASTGHQPVFGQPLPVVTVAHTGAVGHSVELV